MSEPMKLNLGVIYSNGHIIGHRSLLKVFGNPWLRLFGLQIATNLKNGKLGGICLARSFSRRLSFEGMKYELRDCSLERKRRLI